MSSSIAITPASIMKGVTTVLTLVGIGTAWTGGTTFSFQNDTSGSSITSQSVIDGTHATVTVQGGVTAGLFVIWDNGAVRSNAVSVTLFDYLTAINQAIWAAMKAEPDFCCPPGSDPGSNLNLVWPKNMLNFADGPTVDSMLPFMFGDVFAQNAGTSFPRAVLYQDQMTDGMFNSQPTQGTTRTFATMGGGTPPDWIEPIQINYRIGLMFRSCRLDQNNPLKVAGMKAVRSLGPRLGLKYNGVYYVTQVGPVVCTAEQMVVPSGRRDDGMPNGAIRSKCDIRIPVQIRFNGTQLATM